MHRLLKIILALAAISMCLSLTGCWDTLPIENRAIGIAIGIDWLPEEPHYEVTIINPLVSETRGQENRVRTFRAHSLAEALAMWQHTGSQFMSLGMLSVLVVGEDAARQRACFYVNDLYAFPDLRTSAYVVVAKGTAKDLLSVVPPETQRVAIFLRNMMDRSSEQRDSPPTTLYQFVQRMMTPGMDAMTSLLGPIGSLDPRPPESTSTPSNSGSAGGQAGQVQSGGGGQPSQQEDIEVMGAAVWHGDTMVGTIDLPEGQHMSLAQGTASGMLLQVLFTPDERLYPQASRMVVMIEGNQAKWDLTMVNNVPHFKGKIKVRLSLQNYEGTVDLGESENSSNLEEILATNFEQNILAAVQKVSAMGSDPLWLGQQVRTKYPEQWDAPQWGEVIKTAQFKIECDVTIRNIGPQILRLEPVNKLLR